VELNAKHEKLWNDPNSKLAEPKQKKRFPSQNKRHEIKFDKYDEILTEWMVQC
jgi:hypothetical protein